MPFKSAKQERFMFAKHPDIAKRWFREYGNAKKMGKDPVNPQSESHHTWQKGVDHTPKRTPNTDFKGWTPNPVARMKTSKPASVKEADVEDYRPKGIEFAIGSPKGKMGKPYAKYAHPLQRRDVLSATKNQKAVKELMDPEDILDGMDDDQHLKLLREAYERGDMEVEDFEHAMQERLNRELYGEQAIDRLEHSTMDLREASAIEDANELAAAEKEAMIEADIERQRKKAAKEPPPETVDEDLLLARIKRRHRKLKEPTGWRAQEASSLSAHTSTSRASYSISLPIENQRSMKD